MSREGALWIGGLESYMDDAFLQTALSKMGENQLVSIKVMKNKFTGEPASYGFINFNSDHHALMAMHRLNGKVIPDSTPPVRFKLNHQSTRLMAGERDCSIWVGDLTPDVDDLQLYKFFADRFNTVRTAKVVLDNNGFSKGYGFIRFGDEKEQQTALASMMGVSGLGAKPIRVSIAVAKSKDRGIASSIEPSTASAIASMVTGGNQAAAAAAAQAAAAANPGSAAAAQDYNSQYWQYYQNWSQYAAWSQYSQQYPEYAGQYQGQGGQPGAPPPPQPPPPDDGGQKAPNSAKSAKHVAIEDGYYGGYGIDEASLLEGDEFELVEHSAPMDVDLANKKYLARTEEFWDTLHNTGWWQYEEPEVQTKKSSKKQAINGEKK